MVSAISQLILCAHSDHMYLLFWFYLRISWSHLLVN